MKRITIYINGRRASMEDIADLLKRLDEIIEVKQLDNGNIAVRTA